MSAMVWLHDDALRHWYGDAPAVYVFDDEKLRAEHWSLKRIGFIYECLLELPVEIRRGDPVEQVTSFCAEHNSTHVKTMETADPRLQAQMTRLKDKFSLEVIAQEPFVEIKGNLDLRRFSRYWAKAEDQLFASANLIECPKDKLSL